MMFDRLGKARKTWSEDGEVKEVMLDPTIVSEFARPDATINLLQYHNLLDVKEHVDGYVRLHIRPSVSQYLENYMPPSDESRLRALIAVCHLFPGDKDIEPL